MRLLQWMVLTALKWPVIRALAADQLLPLMCIMSRCLYNLKESLSHIVNVSTEIRFH